MEAEAGLMDERAVRLLAILGLAAGSRLPLRTVADISGLGDGEAVTGLRRLEEAGLAEGGRSGAFWRATPGPMTILMQQGSAPGRRLLSVLAEADGWVEVGTRTGGIWAGFLRRNGLAELRGDGDGRLARITPRGLAAARILSELQASAKPGCQPASC